MHQLVWTIYHIWKIALQWKARMSVEHLQFFRKKIIILVITPDSNDLSVKWIVNRKNTLTEQWLCTHVQQLSSDLKGFILVPSWPFDLNKDETTILALVPSIF